MILTDMKYLVDQTGIGNSFALRGQPVVIPYLCLAKKLLFNSRDRLLFILLKLIFFQVLEPITILGNERVTEEQEPPTNFMSSPLAFVMFAFISAVVVIATLVMLVLHCRLRNSVTAFPLSFWRGFLVREVTLRCVDLIFCPNGRIY